MSVADPQFYRTVQRAVWEISVRFIWRYSARAPVHYLVYLAGWALSTNRGSALAVDFVVCGNGTRGECRPNSNVWPPSKFPFRDVAKSSIPIPHTMDEYIKHTHAANLSIWPPSKFPFRDEDTSGIPMQHDMDEYIDQLLAEMPEPAPESCKKYSG